MSQKQPTIQDTTVIYHILIPVLLLLFLAGCGREPDVPANLTPVAITYLAFDNNPEEELLIQGFEEAHPLITVDHQTYTRQPSAYLMDEPPPDVMLLAPGYQLEAAMANGLLADLSDLWSDANLDSVYPTSILGYGVAEGKHHFLPIAHSWAGIFYNRAIFESHGLLPPRSWDELLAICAILFNAGETPIVVAGGNNLSASLWFDYLDLRLNGPDFHQRLLRGQERYDGPAVTEIFDLWRSLLNSGCIDENATTANQALAIGGLARGAGSDALAAAPAVMMLADSLSVAALPPVFMDELGFFAFPSIVPGTPVGEVAIVPGYVIPAGASHRPEANLFLAYLGDAANIALTVPERGATQAAVPIRLDIDEDALPAKARQGRQQVQGAVWVGPPLLLSVPSSMESKIAQMIRMMVSGDREFVAVQDGLEAARQDALFLGEYRQE